MNPRIVLAPLVGRNLTVNALFIRKSKYPVRSIEDGEIVYVDFYLFRAIRLDKPGVQKPIVSHIWVQSFPCIRQAEMKPGDIVRLTGIVSSYIKKPDNEKDWQLSPISSAKVIGRSKQWRTPKVKQSTHQKAHS